MRNLELAQYNILVLLMWIFLGFWRNPLFMFKINIPSLLTLSQLECIIITTFANAKLYDASYEECKKCIKTIKLNFNIILMRLTGKKSWILFILKLM